MDNIFVKNIGSVKQLISEFGKNNKLYEDRKKQIENKFFSRTIFMSSALGCIAGLLLPFTSLTRISLPVHIFSLSFFGLLGAVIGMFGFLILKISETIFIFDSSLKKLLKEKKDYSIWLVKLLGNEEYQKEFIIYLNTLIESEHISPENKNRLSKFRLDAVSLFQSYKIEEVASAISGSVQFLNKVHEELIDCQNKTLILQNYMEKMNLSEVKETHVLNKSGLNLQYDYRTQV